MASRHSHRPPHHHSAKTLSRWSYLSRLYERWGSALTQWAPSLTSALTTHLGGVSNLLLLSLEPSHCSLSILDASRTPHTPSFNLIIYSGIDLALPLAYVKTRSQLHPKQLLLFYRETWDIKYLCYNPSYTYNFGFFWHRVLYIPQAILKFTLQPTLALNWRSSCLKTLKC